MNRFTVVIDLSFRTGGGGTRKRCRESPKLPTLIYMKQAIFFTEFIFHSAYLIKLIFSFE